MSDLDNPIDSRAAKASSMGKFVNPGILLFLDQLIVAAGGGVFWLAVSKTADASDIRHTTTSYSLVLIVNKILQLGFEYPFLKKSTRHRYQILGTVVAIELVISAVPIPIVLYVASSLYEESQESAWLAVDI